MTDQELETAPGTHEWEREMKEEKPMGTDKASWLPQAVKEIKVAIVRAFYFGIGRYVFRKTKTEKWGTGAIDAISRQLQKEMQGLRGFSG